MTTNLCQEKTCRATGGGGLRGFKEPVLLPTVHPCRGRLILYVFFRNAFQKILKRKFEKLFTPLQ